MKFQQSGQAQADFQASNGFLSAEGENSNSNALVGFRLRLLLIIFELALVLLVLFNFQIEREQRLLLILPIIFFGFVIYSFLPAIFRLPFFFLLTNVALIQVLGLRGAAVTTGISLVLILFCHLPVRFSIRVMLLLAAVIPLILIRAGQITSNWGATVLPVVGSMFMFRMILYLQEMSRKEPEPASLWQRLCYFFLLPNVCFLVFPIVDFKDYLRSYKLDSIPVMQKGINWMAWGTLQLLAYRIIYYYWVPNPSEVIDFGSLLIYLLTGYMLLLRICGQAYVAVGILCLFGFDLPPMFHNYFLATGFSDFWRRTYLYWKNFVTKVFYYRLFFKFKKFRIEISVFLTLSMIFLITWFLHSYQFFWVRGVFPINAVDGLFWGIFGVLVAINGIFEAKKGKRIILGNQEWSLSSAFQKTISWSLFFLFMCLLWSLWESVSVQQWFDTLKVVTRITRVEALIFSGVIGAIIFFGVLFQRIQYGMRTFAAPSYRFEGITIILLFIAILGFKIQTTHQNPDSTIAKFIKSIEEPRLNQRDLDTQFRGYYEPLLSRERFMTQFVEAPVVDSQGPGTQDTLSKRLSEKRIRKWEAVQSLQVLNHWGMRDKEYTLAKPANTYRIAILGGSVERGMGVRNEEVFEALVEDRLNKIPNRKMNFEILNFSIGHYDVTQLAGVLKSSVFQFHPDAVFYFAHSQDPINITKNVTNLLKDGDIYGIDSIKNAVEQSGISADMDYYEISRRLKPFIPLIIESGMEDIALKCHKNNVIPVWVALNTPSATPEVLQRRSIAEKYGFLTIDLTACYGNTDPKLLTVGKGDLHPNALGHKMIADVLFEKILENKDKLGMKF